MPSPFDITTVSNTVTLDNNRTGIAVFTVKNNTRRRIHSTARLTTQPPEGAKWLTLMPQDGSSGPADARDFPIDATQSFQVKIAVPMDAAPGAYTMILTVADDNNPDDNYSQSPGVLFTVLEIPKPQPRPFPIWIVAAVIIVVLVIVAIIVAAVVTTNNQHVHETETAVAAVEQTQTAIAQQTFATATAAAVQTQSAIAKQTAVAVATQTALNIYLGDWIPANGADTTALGHLTISSAGGNLLNLGFTSNCLPGSISCSAVSQSFFLNGVPFNPGQLAGSVGNMSIVVQPAGVNQLLVTLTTSGFGGLGGFGTQIAQILVIRTSVPMASVSSSASIAATFAPIPQVQIDQMLNAAAAEAATEAVTQAATAPATAEATPAS